MVRQKLKFGSDYMDNVYGRNFINMIKSVVPGAKEASGATELVVRCPFCGDSKNPRNAHFYISVPTNQDELSFYCCQKCPAGGILNDEVIRKLGCEDATVMSQLLIHNNRVMKLPKYKSLKKINIYPLSNNYIRNSSNNQYKLDYINKRIGSNFTFKDILDLKIFLNLYDVLNSNKLELTRHKNITDGLDGYFIGFISYDNSFCSMRKITDKELYKSINKRYINYSLVNKDNNSKAYYIIPTNIDMLNPLPVRIHIAEGAFDILSIYYNLNKCDKYQNVYIACGGKSYIQAIEFILTEIGVINYELHFYPDKDVTDYDFNMLLNKINLLPTNMYIHRNVFEGEKDFGVELCKIKEVVKFIPEVYI